MHHRLNRLLSVVSAPSAASAVSFSYQYNSANQRRLATLENGAYWNYTYDSLGQVISGRKCWADGTPVDGQQFEYTFDDIGNRISTGGPASSQSTYVRNGRNQYTSRSTPRYVDTCPQEMHMSAFARPCVKAFPMAPFSRIGPKTFSRPHEYKGVL
jgi:hypothetical protein